MPNIVYVLTNPAMPGLVKIGMTDKDDVQQRMNQLFSTGVPFPFECVIAREIDDHNAGDVENALHLAFRPYRANESREFFRIEPQQAEVLLQVMPGRDVTPSIDRQLAAASPEDTAAALNFKTEQARINANEFLGTFSGSARILYERVLDLGKCEGMLITWAAKSFSLYSVLGGARYCVCYGYASITYMGRLYTYFSSLRAKLDIPAKELEALRKTALDSGLFAQAGKNDEVAVHPDRPLTESQIEEITRWIWSLVELIRKHAKQAEE